VQVDPVGLEIVGERLVLHRIPQGPEHTDEGIGVAPPQAVPGGVRGPGHVVHPLPGCHEPADPERLLGGSPVAKGLERLQRANLLAGWARGGVRWCRWG